MKSNLKDLESLFISQLSHSFCIKDSDNIIDDIREGKIIENLNIIVQDINLIK